MYLSECGLPHSGFADPHWVALPYGRNGGEVGWERGNGVGGKVRERTVVEM